MNCTVKHTKFQPTDEQWKCPRCGRADEFSIEENATEDLDCELLHDEDVAFCSRCDASWTGQTVARLLAKQNNLVPCPHCKGKGFVNK